jgi:class 3 adenylate cyclase
VPGIELPETRYAKTPDGLNIAYQVVGSGPHSVVFLPAIPAVDVIWDDPVFAAFLHRLSRLGRLLLLDPRGCGASDRIPLGALPTIEQWSEDVAVVLDAVGAPSATIIGWAVLTPMAMMFAAAHPERSDAIVLIDATARSRRGAGYPSGIAPEHIDALIAWRVSTWGTGVWTAQVASRADDPGFKRWVARLERTSQSPASVEAVLRWLFDLDLRPLLPTIRVPTLVIDSAGSMERYVAENIPGARLLTLGAYAPALFFDDRASNELADSIEEFVTGMPPQREPDRVLATVLFTDVVGSTEHLSRLGDKTWTQLLDQHYVVIEHELKHHRGRRVNTTGDGVVATFDGPARAVRCAQAMVEAVRPLGIDVRAGLHTGEVELHGDDIGGIAVHIGQRVSALAGPGEVLVSRTVVDLVAGSGLEFEERGEHELKGVPGKWAIYAAQSSGA